MNEQSTPLPPAPHMTVPSEDDVALSNRVISDVNNTPVSPVSGSPSTASKASSAALSLASKMAQSGRRMLSPIAQATGSSTSKTQKNSAASSAGATVAAGANTVVNSVGSGLSTLANASSSLGSLLFSAPLSSSSSSATTPSTNTTTTSPTEGYNGVTATSEAATAAATGGEALAEEFRQVSAQQRMKILEDLVQHRRSDWNYLKAMHEGTNYWLNVTLLREQQMLNHLGEKQTIRRSVQFFYLGLGLGRIIGELRHTQFLAMECCQLLEELEFYFSSATVQGMKMMVATSSTLYEPCDTNVEGTRYNLSEPFRPTLYKWNHRPVFRRLLTPPIPFPLDYREVMLSLCDILAIIYSKLVENNSSSENLYLFQAIIRFDERIKKVVIDPVKKEFSAVALQVMVHEMTSVRKMYSSSTSTTSESSTNTSPPSSGTADSRITSS